MQLAAHPFQDLDIDPHLRLYRPSVPSIHLPFQQKEKKIRPKPLLVPPFSRDGCVAVTLPTFSKLAGPFELT